MGAKRVVASPKGRHDFTPEWARRILVDHISAIDPEWMLASVLKVLDIQAEDNPQPGMLSHTFVVLVTYTQGQDHICTQNWFVKVPKSSATAVKDQVEVFMYKALLPLMQDLADVRINCTRRKSCVQMPVPEVLHAHFDHDHAAGLNHIVMQDLRRQGFKPLSPEACGLVFMRAAMTSLATVHASAKALEDKLGGKASLMSRFPLIFELSMPPSKLMKDRVDSLMLPFLSYLAATQPDLQPQLALLTKFHRFLLGVYHDIRRDKALNQLKTVIHGDSKIDNFMFRKASQPGSGDNDDTYVAIMVDWQGACYDLVSADLLWTLYGFLKNLPDKNDTVDTFLDYSICFYHKELLRFLRLYEAPAERLGLPTHEYDMVCLIKKGFIKDFLVTAILKPILTLKSPQLLLTWFHDQDAQPLPSEADIFKTGSNFASFLHLYFTIATEIGVFHDLGPQCIAAMKEVMFGGNICLDDSDDDDGQEHPDSQLDDADHIELAGILARTADQHSGQGIGNDDARGQESGPVEQAELTSQQQDGEEEVVSGVVYIRAALSREQSVAEEVALHYRPVSLQPIESGPQPAQASSSQPMVSDSGSKASKPEAPPVRIRDRLREAQALDRVECTIQELKADLAKISATVRELAELLRHCQESDNAFLQAATVQLSKSVSHFFNACSRELELLNSAIVVAASGRRGHGGTEDD